MAEKKEPQDRKPKEESKKTNVELTGSKIEIFEEYELEIQVDLNDVRFGKSLAQAQNAEEKAKRGKSVSASESTAIWKFLYTLFGEDQVDDLLEEIAYRNNGKADAKEFNEAINTIFRGLEKAGKS